MKIGNKTFENGTHVMAIINLTPDSFYANSRSDIDGLADRVKRAIDEGAEVIDIGGQSTRPGHTPVDELQEWQRLQRPIELIKSRFDVPLSVDTYYPYVAKNALMSGADMINDVWGLTYCPDMAKTIAKYDAAACIMHNARQSLSGDIWGAIEDFLKKSVSLALKSGIDGNKICVDGGIGFAKNREQNLELLNGYEKLSSIGYPLLLGASRKSLFGGNAEDRLPQTVESSRKAAEKGVLFVRVHDVKENAQAIREVYGR